MYVDIFKGMGTPRVYIDTTTTTTTIKEWVYRLHVDTTTITTATTNTNTTKE